MIQMLYLIQLDDTEFSDDNVCSRPDHLLKQSKPAHHLEAIILQKYHLNPYRYIFCTLQENIKGTKYLRVTEEKTSAH